MLERLHAEEKVKEGSKERRKREVGRLRAGARKKGKQDDNKEEKEGTEEGWQKKRKGLWNRRRRTKKPKRQADNQKDRLTNR